MNSETTAAADNARAEGYCTCNGPDSGGRTGDCGVAAHRAEWAAGRAETTTGAIARAEALAAGDPDWMNVTRWPQDETTTTATVEDAAQVIESAFNAWWEDPDDRRDMGAVVKQALADAGLLRGGSNG